MANESTGVNKIYQSRVIQKHDTSASWKKATNFVPLKGEIIIYDDLNKIKIGNGGTVVNDLPFVTPTIPTKLSELTDDNVIAGKYLPLNGGTMSGNIDMNYNNITGVSALILRDSQNNQGQGAIQFSGDSSENFALIFQDAMTSNSLLLKNITSPVDNLDAANKAYVDEQVAANSAGMTLITWSESEG